MGREAGRGGRGGHLEKHDVPIGRVWGIPLQSNTGRGHRTAYLTEVVGNTEVFAVAGNSLDMHAIILTSQTTQAMSKVNV